MPDVELSSLECKVPGRRDQSAALSPVLYLLTGSPIQINTCLPLFLLLCVCVCVCVLLFCVCAYFCMNVTRLNSAPYRSHGKQQSCRHLSHEYFLLLWHYNMQLPKAFWLFEMN